MSVGSFWISERNHECLWEVFGYLRGITSVCGKCLDISEESREHLWNVFWVTVCSPLGKYDGRVP